VEHFLLLTAPRVADLTSRVYITGHSAKTKTARILNWIFIAICGVGNILTLVMQIISTVNGAQDNNSSGTNISSTTISSSYWL